MKKIAMAAGLIVSFAVQAQAGMTLKCWNTYGNSKRPTLVAKIASGVRLNDVQINPGPRAGGTSIVSKERMQGALITSNRSPYKGNKRFVADGVELILPARLDNDSLIAAQETGIGMGKGENGVLIGSGDFDGGSHVSIRLRCRSYEN